MQKQQQRCRTPRVRRHKIDSYETGSGLVAGEADPTDFDRFGQPTADGSKHEGGHVPLRFEGKIGRLAGKLNAAIELKTGFLQEFCGKTEISGAVYTPKPELFLIALEEVERVLELFHGTVEGGGQEENTEAPGVAGVLDADADTVFAGLVALDAAAVVIADDGWTDV